MRVTLFATAAAGAGILGTVSNRKTRSRYMQDRAHRKRKHSDSSGDILSRTSEKNLSQVLGMSHRSSDKHIKTVQSSAPGNGSMLPHPQWSDSVFRHSLYMEMEILKKIAEDPRTTTQELHGVRNSSPSSARNGVRRRTRGFLGVRLKQMSIRIFEHLLHSL